MYNFKAGDKVKVYDFNEGGHKLCILYTGTIVNYWRNDKYIVRHDDNGTTCAHNEKWLELQ